MRQDAVHTEERNGYTIKIMPDEDPQNPREDCDNFGTMVCWHDRYNLGDVDRPGNTEDYLRELACGCHTPIDTDNASMETIWKILDKHYLFLPLYLYDHSGITMSTGPFGCPWDSGQVGFIFVSHKEIRDNWSVKSVRHTVPVPGGQIETEIGGGPLKRKIPVKCKRRKAILMAEDLLRSEVEVYDAYLTGSVYGYVVEKDGEYIDSCWGYIETEHNIEKCYVLKEARSVVDYHAKKAHEEHLKKLKALIREHAPLEVREKELAQV